MISHPASFFWGGATGGGSGAGCGPGTHAGGPCEALHSGRRKGRSLQCPGLDARRDSSGATERVGGDGDRDPHLCGPSLQKCAEGTHLRTSFSPHKVPAQPPAATGAALCPGRGWPSPPPTVSMGGSPASFSPGTFWHGSGLKHHRAGCPVGCIQM